MFKSLGYKLPGLCLPTNTPNFLCAQAFVFLRMSTEGRQIIGAPWQCPVLYPSYTRQH